MSDANVPAIDGPRFGFGANWRRFLASVDGERVAEARSALEQMVGREALAGRSFLDVGSGSGLHSLAARSLGARRVHSFDFDPQSVAVTAELRRRLAAEDDAWTVERGDALDEEYLAGLGTWDVVYSWGVLHHTGDMWRAMDLVQRLVEPGGVLFIALYNDQGPASRRWKAVKHGYHRVPVALRRLYVALVAAPWEIRSLLGRTLRGRPQDYIALWREHKKTRGMSRWVDWIDWVGGLPFEVASPGEVLEWARRHGFALERLATDCGWGCNQYVLRRVG